MKRTALISDIHANMEALEAVMEDLQEQECERILCLGDLIGYGPSPRQVMRVAKDLFEFTLLGNHEEGVLYEPVGFNWKAEASTFWTKDQLQSTRYNKAESEELWGYLEEMARYVQEGDVLFVMDEKPLKISLVTLLALSRPRARRCSPRS